VDLKFVSAARRNRNIFGAFGWTIFKRLGVIERERRLTAARNEKTTHIALIKIGFHSGPVLHTFGDCSRTAATAISRKRLKSHYKGWVSQEETP